MTYPAFKARLAVVAAVAAALALAPGSAAAALNLPLPDITQVGTLTTGNSNILFGAAAPGGTAAGAGAGVTTGAGATAGTAGVTGTATAGAGASASAGASAGAASTVTGGATAGTASAGAAVGATGGTAAAGTTGAAAGGTAAAAGGVAGHSVGGEFAEEAAAELARPNRPFGGIILAAIPCTVTTLGVPGWWFMEYDFRLKIPIPLVIIPTSRVNLYAAPFPGNATLGSAFVIPGICTISGTDYEPYAGVVTGFPYEGIGTSLYPPVFRD